MWGFHVSRWFLKETGGMWRWRWRMSGRQTRPTYYRQLCVVGRYAMHIFLLPIMKEDVRTWISWIRFYFSFSRLHENCDERWHDMIMWCIFRSSWLFNAISSVLCFFTLLCVWSNECVHRTRVHWWVMIWVTSMSSFRNNTYT